jgi:AcrR family transcriptional regulator
MARPRSIRAHDDVLDAASRLFAQRGVDATSMDAIAAESGVSKATIYKHWPDKEALCLEVLARLHGRDQPLPDEDSGDVQADILAVLTYEPPAEFADLRMRMMPHLMAYAARNPAFGKAWRATVFDPPQLQLRMILDRAVTRGALPRTLDRDVAVALLLGPMTYAHVQKAMLRAAPAGLAQASVASFWKAFGIAVAQGPTKARARRG